MRNRSNVDHGYIILTLIFWRFARISGDGQRCGLVPIFSIRICQEAFGPVKWKLSKRLLIIDNICKGLEHLFDSFPLFQLLRRYRNFLKELGWELPSVKQNYSNTSSKYILSHIAIIFFWSWRNGQCALGNIANLMATSFDLIETMTYQNGSTAHFFWKIG